MNRKRHDSETFKQYHLNLKAEEAATKQHLRGRYFHVSTTMPVTRNKGSTYERK